MCSGSTSHTLCEASTLPAPETSASVALVTNLNSTLHCQALPSRLCVTHCQENLSVPRPPVTGRGPVCGDSDMATAHIHLLQHACATRPSALVAPCFEGGWQVCSGHTCRAPGINPTLLHCGTMRWQSLVHMNSTGSARPCGTSYVSIQKHGGTMSTLHTSLWSRFAMQWCCI